MHLSERQQFWINHITNFKFSGLTQAEYCKKYNISKGSFSGQKCALKKKGLLPPTNTEEKLFIPLKEIVRNDFSLKLGEIELIFKSKPDPVWMASFVREIGNGHACI